MEDASGASSARVAKGFLTAGGARIELSALANHNATGLTIHSAATIQRPHLGRTR